MAREIRRPYLSSRRRREADGDPAKASGSKQAASFEELRRPASVQRPPAYGGEEVLPA